MTESPDISSVAVEKRVARALKVALETDEKADHGQPPRSLVLLSGGIDSVAVLANLLQETHHEVHAHHIELSNRENRQDAENDAVADVVEYCWNNFRDFKFSSSKSEFRIAPKGYDLIFAMFHAALVCLATQKDFDYVMTGHFQTSRARAMYGQQMLDSCFLRVAARPRWLRPLDFLGGHNGVKAEICRSVPLELARLCWSCRKPVITADGYEPCGRCYACLNLDQAMPS